MSQEKVMNRFIFKTQAIALASLLILTGCKKSEAPANQIAAATPATTNAATLDQTTVPASDQKYTDAELDEMLAPIALYPDPLLAQMIPAATFFDQLQEAQKTLGGKSDDSLIANQSWDVSVKSVAHYPQVLQMMVENQDRTIAVGQAYVNEPLDVSKSIQRLRAQAKDAGNLVTTKQQQVITKGEVINIEPAQPQVIYVPEYNPEVVYVDNGPSTGEVVAAAAISFGVGLAIGAWLNNDYDYYGRGIYYHGWVGGGWVGVNRNYVNVNVNRNAYINNNFRNVNVNRNIVNRNVSNYRATTLNRGAVVRQQNIERHNLNRTNLDRNRVDRNDLARRDVNRTELQNKRAETGNNRVNRERTQNRVNTGSTLPKRSGGNRQSLNRSSPARTAPTRSGVNRSGGNRSGGGGRRRH
jgi:hypothetical protein